MHDARFHSTHLGRGAGSTLLTTLLAAFFLTLAAPAEQSAPPDAVVELWEQHWTLNADGSAEYYNKQHVRLNNRRPYGEYADPRITYNVDTDELEIINARVLRPDGTYRELSDYSHVQVSPNASDGWPAFAGIRQHLIVMAGIQPGCLVELEYRITSKPGTRSYLAADVRLDHRYPVQHHVVSVSTPTNVPLSWFPRGRAAGLTEPDVVEQDGLRRQVWTYEALPACANEPQSPPWRMSTRRLGFSTGGDADPWLEARLAQIDAAADESELITRLAADWTKDEKQPSDKLRAIQKKLAATFNFVQFPVAWRPATPRPASEIVQCNYGLPAEAAALLLALARAADLPVRPGVLVDDDVWRAEAAQAGMVAAYVVLLDGGEKPEIWDAHNGRIMRDSHWAGHTLASLLENEPDYLPLPVWSDADQSRCLVQGKITISDDGKFAGELSLRVTGLFVSPESLRTHDAQKRRVERLLKRVLAGAKVKSFSVEKLADGDFEVTARVKSGKLDKIADCHTLSFGKDGPFMADISLPLAYSERTNPVHLPGPFDEQIDITIEWPEDWTLEARPANVDRVSGGWGAFQQQVSVAEHSLHLHRQVRINSHELSPADFLMLREPLNTLRSARARMLVLQP